MSIADCPVIDGVINFSVPRTLIRTYTRINKHKTRPGRYRMRERSVKEGVCIPTSLYNEIIKLT